MLRSRAFVIGSIDHDKKRKYHQRKNGKMVNMKVAVSNLPRIADPSPHSAIAKLN